MNVNRFGDLEVIVRAPAGEPAFPYPLLFIHGAYTGAWCWDEHFLPYFARAGYTCYALSLSGHGGTRRPGRLDAWSIDDYVADVLEVAGKLPGPPVLIGHSMGGMVVQKCLERMSVPAAVLLCSVPPQGLMGSAFGMLFSKPSLLSDLNRLLNGGNPRLSSLREALFHQPIDDATLMRYYRKCQPESQRAIWDMTLFNLPRPAGMHRPPMQILGARYDHLIPASEVRMTGAIYGEPVHIFPDLGHGIMLERDWELVAEHIAAWLSATVP